MAEDNNQQAVTTFADDDASQQPAATAATADVNAGGNNHEGDHVFMVVGDRAFQTKDAVATKIQAADQHIVKLEGENRDLRSTVNQQVEEIQRLKVALEGMKQPGTTSGNAAEDNRQLSSEELVQAVVQQVTSKQTAAQREAQETENINTVFAEAQTSYGDNVKKEVGAIAKKLNMSLADVDAMAKTKPNVFRQLFLPQAGARTNSAQPVTGDVNTGALKTEPEKSSWSAAGKSSKEIAAEVGRRLAAMKDE